MDRRLANEVLLSGFVRLSVIVPCRRSRTKFGSRWVRYRRPGAGKSLAGREVLGVPEWLRAHAAGETATDRPHCNRYRPRSMCATSREASPSPGARLLCPRCGLLIWVGAAIVLCREFASRFGRGGTGTGLQDAYYACRDHPIGRAR